MSAARLAVVALRRPALRLLLFGYFTFCLARKASRVVVVVYAFDRGGVATASAVAVIQLLPAVVTAPLGSVIGERLQPARALALGYAIQAAALLACGSAMAVDGPLPVITALAAVAAGAFTLSRPVHLATMPDVADSPEELTLGNAASVWVDGVASVAGPLLAGLGLATVRGGPVLVALGAATVVAALASARLRVTARARSASSPLESVLGGARALGRDHDASRLLLLTGALYALMGLLDVLLVVVVVEVLGLDSAAAGPLGAALGVGAVIGGSVSLALAGRERLAPALLLGASLAGLPVLLLGVSPLPALTALLVAAAGAGKGVLTVAAQTLLQRTVHDDVATRVFGVQESLIQAATAAGSALGPLLVLVLGAAGAPVAAGLMLPLVVLLVWRGLGRLDARAVVPGPVFALLRTVTFLRVLPLRTLERLARDAGREAVSDRGPVIREGEPGDRYYVVESGAAQVSIHGVPARVLGPGDGFGEIALMRDVPRTATVVADGPLTLVTIDRGPFLEAVTGVPDAHAEADRAAADALEADRRRAANGMPGDADRTGDADPTGDAGSAGAPGIADDAGAA